MAEGAGPSAVQLPIARRTHKKSKTGCRSCKRRKVKCDERRPLCVNCERHFVGLLTCDFDDSGPTFADPLASSSSSTGASGLEGLTLAPHAGNPARRPQPARQRRRFRVQSHADSSVLPTRDPSATGRLAEPLNIPRDPSAGRLDPFEARPPSIGPNRSIDALMGHYLANFAYRSFPFYASRPLIQIWWPFVREDEVLFHVVLLLSSLDRDHLNETHDSVTTRQLLSQCLSLLNARVGDPVAGVNDHTLVAVASLAAMEHNRGNMRALSMHLAGLKQIVEVRGGLDLIRQTNAMAANLVFWSAMVSINEPALLPITYGHDLTELQVAASATFLTHDGGEKDLRDFGVDVPTASILHDVQLLSRDYTSTVNYGTPQEATDVLSQLCSVIEKLLQMSRSPSNDSPIAGLSQSCRLAGCLHVFTPLSGYFPDPTLMLHTLVRDLKASLTQMIRAVGTESHLLLWLLAVGGITAHSMPERGWFVGHLVVVVTDLGIRTWDDMRHHLIQLAFHDNFCDTSFKKLWHEVQAKQEMLNLAPSEPEE